MPEDAVPEDAAPRDRDPSGRPRNARPRDGLGRPLARTGTSAEAGQDRIPDDLVITGRDAAVLADRLLREGRPFHAHEVLEAAWKTGPPEDRDLWQGLAQIAVGLTHAQRGNATGAAALLRRGADRVRGYLPAGAGPHGIDVAGIVQTADALAAGVERSGVTGVSPGGLRLRTVTAGG